MSPAGQDKDDRKARLAALKKRADGSKGGGDEKATLHETGGKDGKQDSAPKLVFRNYEPKDDRIKHEKVEATHVKGKEAPVLDVERAIGRDVSEVIANVAPKKPCWDLRKEIAGKLAKLERRTQRAIVELAVEEEKRRMADA